MLICAFLVVFFPPALPVPTEPHTVDYYNTIEATPKGSVVYFGTYFDYITAYVQSRDLYKAKLSHWASRDFKIVMLAFGQVSIAAFDGMVSYSNIEGKYGYEYGIDYVIMPYLSGDEPALAAAADIYSAYQTDVRGTPISQIPLLQQVRGLKDAQLIVYDGNVLTAPAMFVRQWAQAYNVKMIGGSFGELSVYYGKYVFGTMESAALYEFLSKNPGEELNKLDMLNLELLFTYGMIGIGILYNVRKKLTGKSETTARGGGAK